MAMQKHYDQPGSPAWHARRAGCFNAGDAAALLGCHPSGVTRTQLMQALATGLEREFSDYVQEKVINPGHQVEAVLRAAAEDVIGEDLQVIAFSLDIGLSKPLGASLDGITFMEDTVWECKSSNEALRTALPHTGRDSHARNDARNLPKGYRVQCEQQQLCSGASRTLFTVGRLNPDGSIAEERHAWYTSDPDLRAEIVGAWKLADAELPTFVAPQVKERPPAEVSIQLPALVIHAKGEITTSNMKEYGEALAKRLAEVRAIALVTDQDFSNAKESAKLLRENIQQAKVAKEQMLAQTVTVGEAARMIDTWCEDMRVTALKLEQDVEREDRLKKSAMMLKAKQAYDEHIEALKRDTGGPWIVLAAPDWAGAIKNKRSYTSMQDSLDTALANGKIAADESARKIRAALAALDEEAKGYEHLFADRLSFISKPADDVRQLVRARVTEHKAAEERRAAELAERERARIRAEEEARAREQAAREQREQQEREAAERRQREEAEALRRRQEQEAAAREQRQREEDAARAEQQRQQQPLPSGVAGGGIVGDGPDAVRIVHAAPAVIPMPTRASAAAATPPSLRLGVINERLQGICKVSAEDLASLGYPAAGRSGSAILFHESDWPYILTAMAQRLVALRDGQKEAA